MLATQLPAIVRDAPASDSSLKSWRFNRGSLHLNRLPTVLRCNKAECVTLQIGLVKLGPRLIPLSPCKPIGDQPLFLDRLLRLRSVGVSKESTRQLNVWTAQINDAEDDMEQDFGGGIWHFFEQSCTLGDFLAFELPLQDLEIQPS